MDVAHEFLVILHVLEHLDAHNLRGVLSSMRQLKSSQRKKTDPIEKGTLRRLEGVHVASDNLEIL